ncbi:hypothetical protein N9E48_11205, partial [Paracoccaceae bacterium]|nr:hypothetical protein [Paracoccaceae bacterium]
MLIIKDDSLSALISSSLETQSSSGQTSFVTLDVSLKEHQDTIIWNFSDQEIVIPSQYGHSQNELAALSALHENEVVSLSEFVVFDELNFIGSAGSDYVVIDGLNSSFTVEPFDRARNGISFGNDHYIGDSHYLTIKLDNYNLGLQLDAEILDGNLNLSTLLGSVYAENVDRLDGGDLADILSGDDNSNVIYGQGGEDTIYGGAGNDTLHGGFGSDVISGGNGDDWLNGGADGLTDYLTGGPGSDTFYFPKGFGHDVIVDFSDGSDVLSIEDMEIADINNLPISLSDEGHSII